VACLRLPDRVRKAAAGSGPVGSAASEGVASAAAKVALRSQGRSGVEPLASRLDSLELEAVLSPAC